MSDDLVIPTGMGKFVIGLSIGVIIGVFVSMLINPVKENQAPKIADNIENILRGGDYQYRSLILTQNVGTILNMYDNYNFRLKQEGIGQARIMLEELAYQVCYGTIKGPENPTTTFQGINISLEKTAECMLS